MRVIDQRYMIRTARARFRQQYHLERPGDTTLRDGRSVREIDAALARLNLRTATAAEVDAAVGSEGWAVPPTCDECNAPDGRAVVRMDGKRHERHRFMDLCVSCINDAARLVGLRVTADRLAAAEREAREARRREVAAWGA